MKTTTLKNLVAARKALDAKINRLKTITLKNFFAARRALNAEINRLENNTIKVGDFVYLKNGGRDIYGNYHTTHLYDPNYSHDLGRIEYKIVEAKGNNVMVILVEGYDPKGHKVAVFNRDHVYLCKKPREEAIQKDRYFKDLMWTEWEKATGKRREWNWEKNAAPR